MSSRYLRLVCRPTQSDLKSYPMFLDAPVESSDEGSFIIMKGVLCGFMGEVNGDVDPFILRKDKSNELLALPYRLDFGSYYGEDRYRYYNTNIVSKNISKGTQFTIRWFDEDNADFEEKIYEVREIVDLVNGRPLDSI